MGSILLAGHGIVHEGKVRRRSGLLCLLTTFLIVVLTLSSIGNAVAVPPRTFQSSFSFAAAGDWAYNSFTFANWQSLKNSGVDFVTSLGDMLYSTPSPTLNEQTWCGNFKSYAPNLELLVGNHETSESNATLASQEEGGSIVKYLQYCPFTLNSLTGTYGFQYYFDYPQPNPLARVILVDPGIWEGATISTEASYANNTANQAWVGSAIDSARASGIPWVIVGMHKVCISTGSQGCEIGQDFTRFLIQKRVDLVIQGHDHNYQRSKQLICANSNSTVFPSDCVANDGSTGNYSKGSGTVFLIVGTGGAGDNPQGIETNNDTPYFARMIAASYGYAKFTVTRTSLQEEFVNTEGLTFSDQFGIGDYSLSADPASLTSSSSNVGNSTITVDSPSGFSGTVELSASISPCPTGCFTTSFTPYSSLNVGPGGGINSTTLRITMNGSPPPRGVYNITVTGTSGSLAHTTLVQLNWAPGLLSLTLSATPSFLAEGYNVTGTAIVTVAASGPTPQNMNVNLFSTVSPGGLDCSLSTTSLALTFLSNTASSILTCRGALADSYSVTVSGSSAELGLSNSTTLSFTVLDFGIATPPPVDVRAGQNVQSAINLNSLNGFAGVVSVTATVSTATANGVSVSLNPSSVGLLPNSGATTLLTLSTSPSTPGGQYSIVLTATNGQIIHHTSFVANVTADFSLFTAPSVNMIAGSQTTSLVTLNSFGFNGTITLVPSVSPSALGLSVSLNNGNVTLAPGTVVSSTLVIQTTSATPGQDYTLNITATSNTLIPITHVTTIRISVASFTIAASPPSVTILSSALGNSTITLNSQNNFAGTVSITAAAPVGLFCSANPGITSLATSATTRISCYSPLSAVGIYNVNVTATSGLLQQSTTIVFTVQDFTLTPGVNSISVRASEPASTPLTITSTGGYSGSIDLSLSVVPPSGLNCQLSTNTIVLGASGVSTLSCFGSLGLYHVTVTAKGNGLSHQTLVTFSVQDYTISASPSSININPTLTATSLVTVQSANGFNGTVTLFATHNPTAGVTCNLSPTSLTLGLVATSTLSCNGTPGIYSVTVSGASGIITHSTQIQVTIQDFAISSASSVTIVAMNPPSLQITITPINGFNGTVSLSVSSQTGLSCQITPSSVSLGPTRTSALTCDSSQAGNYLATVTGTSSGLTHSAAIAFAVSDFSISIASTSLNSGAPNVSIPATLASINGFNASLSLSTVVSPSTGLSVNCPSTATLSNASISVQCGLVGSTPSAYTLTVTGHVGLLTHSSTALIHVGDFEVSVPASITFNLGVPAIETVVLTSTHNYAGVVTIIGSSSSQGLSINCSSNPIVLIPNATVTTTCSLSDQSAPGTYTSTITVTDNLDGIVHSRTTSVRVGSFLLSTTQGSLRINLGSSANTFSVDFTSTYGFNGTVSLSTSVDPSTGLSISCPAIENLSPDVTVRDTCTIVSSTSPGSYLVTLSGSGSPGSASAQAVMVVSVGDFSISLASVSPTTIIAGSTGNTTVSLTSTNFVGVVNLSISAEPGTSCTLSTAALTLLLNNTATSLLSCGSSLANDYHISINATAVLGTATHAAGPVTFHIVDFSITASSSLLAVPVGASLSSTITITSLNQFTGTVTFAESVVPSAGLTCSISPSSITLQSPNGNANLHCNATLVGNYTITVTAANSQLIHSTTLNIRVQDFIVSVNSAAVTFHVGDLNSTTIALGSVNGFANNVTLDYSVSPQTGLTCNFNPIVVAVVSSASSTLVCSSTHALSYTVAITATSGPLDHSTSVSFIVWDFTITSGSISSFTAGSSILSSVNVTSLGLTGLVSLNASISSAAGLTASISPTSLSVNPGSVVSSILTISSTSATPSGSYAVTIIGTSGTLTRTMILSFTINPEFALAASPPSVTSRAGSSANSTISVHSLGLTGSVLLTASISPNIPQVLLSRSSIQLTPDLTDSSFLTVYASASGTYTITITGTSGTTVHSTSITLTVEDFSISSDISTVLIHSGSSGTVVISLQSLTGFAGSVDISVSSTPSGISANFTPQTATLAVNGSASTTLTVAVSNDVLPQNSTITIVARSSGIVHTIQIQLRIQDFQVSIQPASLNAPVGSTSSIVIRIDSLNGYSGSVSLSFNGGPGGPQGSIIPSNIFVPARSFATSSAFVFAGSLVGNYTAIVSATSQGQRHDSMLEVSISDFTVFANSQKMSVQAGSSNSTIIHLSSVNGFIGDLALTGTVAPSSPNNPILSFVPATLTVSGSSSSSLSVTTTASTGAGNYNLTVTVSLLGGNLTHNVTIQLVVKGDFAITSAASSIGLTAGKSTSTSLNINSAGFSGTVAFSSSVTPLSSTAPMVSFSPASVTLSPGGTIAATLTVSASTSVPAGTYTVNVTATGGTLSRSTTIIVTVLSNYSITLDSPLPGSIDSGEASQAEISLASAGFTGSVTLTASSSPLGLTLLFNQTIVSLSPGQSDSVTLNIQSSGSMPAGIYFIEVNATSGTLLIRSTTSIILTANFTIQASPPTPGSFVAGGSTTTIITLNSLGLSDTIGLNCITSPDAAGITTAFDLTSVNVTPGSSAISQLTIFSRGVTAAGTYTVTITGTRGSTAHSTTIAFIVLPDFIISADPVQPDSIVSGSSAIATLTGASKGLTGILSLSQSVSPFPSGITIVFLPDTISLAPGSSSSSTITVSTSRSTPAGSYTILVTATTGSLSHTISLPITVSADFDISAAPLTNPTIVAGTNTSSTITLESSGFAGDVALEGFPAPVSGIAAIFTSATITLTTGESGTSVLTITTQPNTPSGTYVVVVTATNGSISHSTTISVMVTADFSIIANAVTPPSIVAGSYSTATITIDSMGLTGHATLAASSPSGSNILSTLDTPILSLTPGISVSSTLTIQTSPITPSGTYTITLTASSGLLTRTVSLSIIVNPDFELSAQSPIPSEILAGSTATSTLTATSLGFSGNLTLSIVSSPSADGITTTFNPATLSLTPGSTSGSTLTITTSISLPEGIYSLSISGSNGAITHSALVQIAVKSDFTVAASTPSSPASFVAGGNATSTITLTSEGYSGNVVISVQSLQGFNLSLNTTSLVLSPGISVHAMLTIGSTGSTPSGSYLVTVTGTGNGVPAHSSTVAFNVTPDFLITASSPSPASFISGGNSTSTVTIVSLGLSGNVGLTTAVSTPVPGLTVSFSSATLLLSPGTSRISLLTTVTTNATPSAVYSIIIAGSSGGIVHSMTISITVNPDFTIASIPASPTAVLAGDASGATLSLASQGFTGPITLTPSPSQQSLTASLSASSLQLTPGSSSTSTLTITTLTSTPPGSYSVLVLAAGGGLSHSISIVITVTQDFSITVETFSPTTIISGATTSSTVTLISYGLSDSILLSVSANATGAAFSISPNPVNVNYGTTRQSTLTVSTTTSTPSGTYVLTITATAGAISHSVTGTVIVIADFTVNASTVQSTFRAGGSTTATITLGSIGLTGTLTVTTTVAPSPTGLTASVLPTNVPLTAGTTSTTLLTVSSTASTPSGVYTLTIRATTGTLTHTTTLSVTVAADLTIAATPPSPGGIIAGSPTTSTVSLQSLGLTDSVSLSASVPLAATDMTVSFNPTSVSLTPGLAGSSTLVIQTMATTPAGSYLIQISTSGNSPIRTTAITIVVNSDFTISSSPLAPSSVLAGGSAGSTIRLDSLGFTGTVLLGLSISPQATDLQASLDGNTVQLSPGSSESVSITVYTTSSTPSNSYQVLVSGVGGTKSHSIVVVLNITSDFEISATDPTPSSFIAAGSSTSTLTVSSLGFTGSIDSTTAISPLAEGLAVTLDSLSALSPGTSTSSTVRLSTSSFTPSGTYYITVTITGNGTSHSLTLSLTVLGSFTISAGPASPFSFTAGGSSVSTILLTSSGFAGTIALSVTVSSGILPPTATLDHPTITLSPGISASAVLTIASSTSTYSGNYTINIAADSGTDVETTTVQIAILPDFTITASSPSPVSIVASDSTTTVLTLSSIGFAGPVTLLGVVPASANGASVSFSASTIQLAPGSSGLSTLTFSSSSSTPADAYTLMITGSSSSIARSVQITIIVTPDFTLTTSPLVPASFIAGGTSSSTFSIGSLGFTGSVGITVAPSQNAKGLSVGISPTSVNLIPGGSGSGLVFALTKASTPAGTYTIILTANGAGTTHSLTLSFEVLGDFSIIASQATPSIFLAGGTASSTISLDSQGFSGTVNLSTSPIVGLSITFSDPAPNLTPGLTASTTLTITTSSSTPSGTYALTIMSNSGSLTRTAQVTITVGEGFSITATQSNPVHFIAGSGSTSTITVTSLGFSGTVSLSATVGLALINAPIASLNPSSLTLQPGQSRTSTLSITTTSSTSSGSYSVTIIGTSTGIDAAPATVLFNVDQDFSISANPSSLPGFIAGSSANSTVTLNSIGLDGPIALTASVPVTATGLTVSFSLGVIQATAGVSSFSTLTISTLPSTAAGTYTVTVRGTSGSLTHSVSVSVTVLPDFTITASTVAPMVCASSAASSSITITSLGFSGTVQLTASLSPASTGIATSFSSAAILLSTGGSDSSTLTLTVARYASARAYTLTITGTSGALTQSVSLSVTVTPEFTLVVSAISPGAFVASGSATATVTIDSLCLQGNVAITAAATPISTGMTASINPNPVGLALGGSSSSTLTLTTTTATLSGTYTIALTATSGSIVHTTTINLEVDADFQINATSPVPSSWSAGSTGNSTVTLVGYGYSGDVQLSVNVSPLLGRGPSTNFSANPVSLTPGSSGSSILTISTSPSTASGTYTLVIMGTTGSVTHSTSFTITISGDFTVEVSPTSHTVPIASSANGVVILNSTGFSGPISLVGSVSPILPGGPSVIFGPSTVTLTPGASVLSTITVTVPSTTLPGTYNVAVNATSGSIFHLAVFTIGVNDFSVSFNQQTLTAGVGSSAISTLTVSSNSGFNGTITLVPLSSGQALVCSLSSGSVILSGASSASSTLTCNGSSAGTYTVTVTAVSGSILHAATISLIIQDFVVTVDQSGLTALAGNQVSTATNVAGLNGLTGTITLWVSVQPNLVCALSSNTVTLSNASPSSTSTLSCTGTAGVYSPVVTGTIGSLVHSATVPVTVQDFTVNANVPTLSLVARTTQTFAVSLTGQNGFGGLVALSVSVSPSNDLTCTLSPTTMTLSPTLSSGSSTISCSGSAGVYDIMVTGISGSLSHSLSSPVVATVKDFSIAASPTGASIRSGGTANVTITVSSLHGFSGPVTLSSSVSPPGLVCIISGGGSLNLTSQSSPITAILRCSGTLGGLYNVAVTGVSGSLSHTVLISLTVQDFVVSATPGTLSINAESSGLTVVNLTSLNGFAGTVSLTATTTPSTGLSCTFTPPTVFLGATGSSTLSCGGVAGTYIVSVRATSDSLTHNVQVTYRVQDFLVTAAPSSVLGNAGASASSTVTITGINGFSGTVGLSFSVSPSTGLNCDPLPSTITLSQSASSATANLSCSGPTGVFSILVVGSSSGLVRSATITYTIQDFTLGVNPTGVVVTAGTSGNVTVTVGSVQGFSGTVNIAMAITPASGLTCSLSRTVIIGSSGSSQLTCLGSIQGSYSITITGTSGSLSHSGVATYTVTDFLLTASPSTVTTLATIPKSSSIGLSAATGFTKTVVLAISTSGTGLICSLSQNSITPDESVTLTCAGSVGSYTVTLSGTASGVTHTTTVNVIVQDFIIGVNPSSLIVAAYSNANTTISLTGQNAFNGSVALTYNVSPAGLSCTLSPTTITPGTSSISRLSCNSHVSGNYTVTVTGISGSVSHSTAATVYVTDFSLTISPLNISSDVGVSTTQTVRLVSINGFTDSVALTVAPLNGLSCSISPSVVSGSQLSNLSCKGSASGTYTVVVTGTSSGLVRTASTTVTEQDFTISTSTPRMVIVAGSAGQSAIFLTSQSGFAGNVTLAVLVSPSSGLTCAVNPPSLVLGSSGTTMLSCVGSAGTYTVNITGTSGPLSHSALIVYTVQDFTISASPTIVTAIVGNVGISTISIRPVNGFNRTLTLSVSFSGLSCTISSYVIPNGAGNASLSCVGPATGTFLVRVNATYGSLTHSVTPAITFNVVPAPDFSIAASPATVTVVGRASAFSTITITPLNSFTGTVSLTASVSPLTGLFCTLDPGTMILAGTAKTSTLSCTGASGQYSVLVNAEGGGVAHTATITVKVQDFTITAFPTVTSINVGATASITVTLVSQNGFSGTVVLTYSPPSPSGLTCSFTNGGNVTLTSTSTVPSTLACSGRAGNYRNIIVSGTFGTLSHSAGPITVTVQDYVVSASQPTPVTVGAYGVSTLDVTALYGFSGIVSLNVIVPAGLSCLPISPSVFNGTGGSLLKCTSSIPNTFTVTVTGTSSPITHSTSVTFNFRDFSILASPATITVISGFSGSVKLTLHGLNGFIGNVKLSLVSGSGSISVSPQLVMVSSEDAISSLTIGAFEVSPGTYTVVVDASFTSGSAVLSHNVQVRVTVAPAPVIAVAPIQRVTVGSTLSFTINVTDQDPSRTIILTATGIPVGALFQASEGQIAFTALFTWAPSDAQGGKDYNVTFTADDYHGAVVSTTVTIHVISRSQAAPLLSVNQYWFVALAALAIAVLTPVLLKAVKNGGKKSFLALIKGQTEPED